MFIQSPALRLLMVHNHLFQVIANQRDVRGYIIIVFGDTSKGSTAPAVRCLSNPHLKNKLAEKQSDPNYNHGHKSIKTEHFGNHHQ